MIPPGILCTLLYLLLTVYISPHEETNNDSAAHNPTVLYEEKNFSQSHPVPYRGSRKPGNLPLTGHAFSRIACMKGPPKDPFVPVPFSLSSLLGLYLPRFRTTVPKLGVGVVNRGSVTDTYCQE